MHFLVIFLLVTVLTDAVPVTEVETCKGESVILLCSMQSNYINTFVRFQRKKVHENNQKYKYLKNGTLLVENVTESDEGLYGYHCKYRTNCSRSQVCKIHLKIDNNCEVLEVNSGSTIKMTCKTTKLSDTIKEIQWFKSAIPKSIKLSRTKSQTKKMFSGRLDIAWDVLRIAEARQADEGEYYCIMRFNLKKGDFGTPKSHYEYRVRVKPLSNDSNNSKTTLPVLSTTKRSSIKTESTTAINSATFSASTPQTYSFTDISTIEVSSHKTTTMIRISNTSNNTTKILAHKSCGGIVLKTDLYMCEMLLMVLVRLMTPLLNLLGSINY